MLHAGSDGLADLEAGKKAALSSVTSRRGPGILQQDGDKGLMSEMGQGGSILLLLGEK